MNPFVRKLQHGTSLTQDDQAALARLTEPSRRIERGDITPEDTEPHFIVLVMEGWVCRYKQLENGKRQITSVFLPGDLCEPFGALPRVMDHTLSALTPVRLARVSPNALRAAAWASAQVEKALWWDLLLSEAIGRERMVSLGRRSATERLGHFFCEVLGRLQMAGLADGTSCDLPLIQADLADLLGLSSIHVNRALQDLRNSGVLSLRKPRLTVHDTRTLQELSMFDPAYLSPYG